MPHFFHLLWDLKSCREEEAENAREEEGGGRPGESRARCHFIVVLVALPGPEDCRVEKQGNTTAEVAHDGQLVNDRLDKDKRSVSHGNTFLVA